MCSIPITTQRTFVFVICWEVKSEYETSNPVCRVFVVCVVVVIVVIFVILVVFVVFVVWGYNFFLGGGGLFRSILKQCDFAAVDFGIGFRVFSCCCFHC